MNKKIVFIAHPIAGDIENNMKKSLQICEDVHTKEIIPVAPYLVSLRYLNDNVIEDRELGKEANLECFHRRYLDELWLFGDKISSGMKEEILLARELGIPVIAKTEGTKIDLKNLK
ncbi:MAG: DUF4406 domain-containing protein [Patescibacteria group bacterium]